MAKRHRKKGHFRRIVKANGKDVYVYWVGECYGKGRGGTRVRRHFGVHRYGESRARHLAMVWHLENCDPTLMSRRIFKRVDERQPARRARGGRRIMPLSHIVALSGGKDSTAPGEDR